MALRAVVSSGFVPCLLSAVVAAGTLAAQEPKVSLIPGPALHTRPSAPPSNFRLDVKMILVPVTVTDATDHPVTGLPAKGFRLFEDNVEQDIVSFSREEGPVSVGFIFDTSSSMKNRISASIKAVDQFLKSATPGDEFFLVQFSDEPKLVTDFTAAPDDIAASLSRAQPIGWTALNDAIYFAVQHMKTARNRRHALFVLSDGGDNNSRYSDGEVRNLVREGDVRVYSIGLFERTRLLDQLAADSGARSFTVHKLDDLPDAVDHLSQELRNQYVLGYLSKTESNDGKYRKVRVQLMETIQHFPLNVFWRRGYFAPSGY